MIPVTMIMAITVDGKIAKNSQQFANWTSPEDKKLFVEVSKAYGVIMMGENTFKTFSAPLKNRLNVVFSRQKNPPKIEGVKWVEGEPEKVLTELEEMGFKSVLLGGGTNLNSLFLEKKLIQEIIITIEPKIFGQGLSLFDKSLETDLKLLEIKQLNENVLMLRYKVL